RVSGRWIADRGPWIVARGIGRVGRERRVVHVLEGRPVPALRGPTVLRIGGPLEHVEADEPEVGGEAECVAVGALAGRHEDARPDVIVAAPGGAAPPGGGGGRREGRAGR